MLKKPKVAIFSDLHLGIYGNSENWHKIALNWADWISSELSGKKIKDILFLGDFFHNRSEISVQTIHVASMILEKLKNFNIIMVVGNHDAYYKNRSDVHSLGLICGHENIHVVDEVFVLDEFEKKLLFVPWNADLPNGSYDYIFGHFEIRNFRMNNSKVCDHGLNATDFLSGRTSRVFSGHFHHRTSKKYKEGEIHFVGNTFPMDLSDMDNLKGYHILDLEDGKLEFFENTVSPKFKKIYATKLKEYGKEDFQNNVLKLIIDLDATEKQVEKLQSYILKFKPFFLNTEYFVNVRTIDDVEDLESVDLAQQFTEYIDQLKFDDEKEKRIKILIKELYERNK